MIFLMVVVMNKDSLMMKAVVQLNGKMDRNYNGLVYATSKNPSFSEGTVGHWDTGSKSGFLDHMDDHDTWGWLCTRAEFDQFIDELVEGCIKWGEGMSIDELMMKAVIKFKGEWPIFGWGNLDPEKRALGVSLISDIGIDKGGIYCIDRKCDSTWSVLCAEYEFQLFIDELLETCIKWDKPKWAGEGLPPVGVECEFMCTSRHKPRSWTVGTVKYASPYSCVIEYESGEGEFIAHPDTMKFRPIKTETEKERERLVDLVSKVITRKTGSYLSVEQKELIDELFDAGFINAPSTKAD